ncbi:MAG: hypothetical protein EAX86_08865 [Candidatus Heimdallarchaeota archaeon]|nr:hypothetical protein [Candidatus Heimdallarchaeota archaeon]
MKINYIFQIKTNSEKEAKLIQSALEPDNNINPPMSIHSQVRKNKVIFTIKSISKIETALTTFFDILSLMNVVEEVLTLKTNEENHST